MIDSNMLGSYLDAYILITGDYDLAYKALNKADISFENVTNYTALINIGSTFAAELDSKCLEFFESAYSVTNNVENKVVALHRQAAYLVKRSSDTSAATKKLHELVEQISVISVGWRRQIYMALANNLFALLIVKQGLNKVNVATITYLLMGAETLVDSLPEFNNYDRDNSLIQQSQRYRSQIEMNYAQILIDSHQLPLAIKVLSNNLKHVSVEAPDYLCEAFATLGYAYYLKQDYPASISNLQQALREYSKQGALHEAANTKEILIAAMFKNGDTECAGKLFNSLSA